MIESNESRKRVGRPQNRSCEQCQAEFRPKTSRHKFCSAICCRQKHGIGQITFQEQACETCRTSFKQCRLCQRFCSEACRTKHHNAQKAKGNQMLSLTGTEVASKKLSSQVLLVIPS
jgi:hypothetical protein